MTSPPGVDSSPSTVRDRPDRHQPCPQLNLGRRRVGAIRIAYSAVTVHGGRSSRRTCISVEAAAQLQWQSRSVPMMPPLRTPGNASWCGPGCHVATTHRPRGRWCAVATPWDSPGRSRSTRGWCSTVPAGNVGVAVATRSKPVAGRPLCRATAPTTIWGGFARAHRLGHEGARALGVGLMAGALARRAGER